MPKRRSRTLEAEFSNRTGGGSSGGVSGRVSGGAGGGISARPENRRVTISLYSQSRNREEQTTVEFTHPGRAIVYSGSGNAYQVSYGENPSCECPDFRFRASSGRAAFGNICRHIVAARRAERFDWVSDEEVAAATTVHVPRTAQAGFDASEAAAAALERLQENRSIADRLAVVAAAEVAEINLTDDTVFNDLLERAKRGDFSYEYENVLGNSDVTFGVEIEFEGGDRRAIARELYERRLIPEPHQTMYHGRRVPGMWAFEYDNTVSGELVSPIFRDTPEAWRQIEEICEIIRKHGGRGTSSRGSVGCHVHISRIPIDDDNIRWRRLLNLCRQYEDVLYRIGAGGESGGKHRGTRYAIPLARASRDATRLAAMNCRPTTIEFRYFNGTLDPKQIQTYVRIAHALVRTAGRTTEQRRRRRFKTAPYRSIQNERAVEEERTHAAVRGFLDHIFSRTKDKLAALWLYATSRWQAA